MSIMHTFMKINKYMQYHDHVHLTVLQIIIPQSQLEGL